ncbi:sugar kinase [Lacticigenium naphthae]|uniref:sugar kinase n=1 Tax=Lacticigenium naphthae TaxID=515351 RepID=UPI00041EA5FB|nr:sugar kinase [Lacticigenium naphthae]
MKKVLLIGEAMGLFKAEEYGDLKNVKAFTKSLAGAEFNVGIGLSRLNHTVEMITKLGKDPVGEYIYDQLKNENIGSRYVIFDSDTPTGIMLKNKVKNGDPDTAYYRKCTAFGTLTIEDIEAIDFSTIDLLHITGIPLAINTTVREVVFYLVDKAKQSNVKISFDPNLRPALWKSKEEMIEILNKMAGHADVVLPGISEGALLTGSSDPEEIAKFYLDRGAQCIIIKTGSTGAFVAEKNKQAIQVPGFAVEKIVDTVGAGDGFAVGVISAYLEGASWQDAAIRANAIGSIQIQHAGDNENLPTQKELTAYIKQYNQDQIESN